MTEHKFTDDEIIRAFDILDKFEFFGGQRAGRELWFNKPADIQNKDIGGFLRDLDFLKQFINRQKAEIERLQSRNKFLEIEYKNQGNLFWARVNIVKTEAIKEFAERLKEKIRVMDRIIIYGEDIDNLVKEMTEGK